MNFQSYEIQMLKRILSFFTSGNKTQLDGNWQLLRKYQPNGPLVNSEFYPGWYTHWQESQGKVDPAPVAESLR